MPRNDINSTAPPVRTGDGASPPPQGGSQGGSQSTIVTRLESLTAGIQQVLQTIRSVPPGGAPTPEQDAQIQRMQGYIPELARASADMMEFMAVLFQGFPFTGAQLRANEEEVRAIGEFLSFLQGALTEINDFYAASKGQLGQRTMMVVGQVTALKTMPALPAGLDRDKVKLAATPLDDILGRASASVQGVKKTHKDLVAQGDQQTEQVQAELAASRLETSVLRGQQLTSGAVAAAAPQKTPAAKKPSVKHRGAVPPGRKGQAKKTTSKKKR